MKKGMKRVGALMLSVSMLMGLTACGGAEQGTVQEGSSSEVAGTVAESSAAGGNGGITTISLYPANANLTSGTVSGYMGDFFAENGLSVDVWAYSDEKTNAILSSGNLPDIMYVTAENLEIMIDSGMVLQLDEYLEKIPHVVENNEILEPAFEYIRQFRSNGTGSVYAMPTNVGPTQLSDIADRNMVRVNWSIYEEIGKPAINSYDDLITVAKQMMEAHPTDENGNKIYGTILNSGSDTTYWGNSILWMRWNGYSEKELPYLIEADMLNGTYSSILEENSMYYQGLEFYFKAMQEGIVDPDSINTDRSTAGAKARMFGGGTQPGWHDTYFEYYIPGMIVYCNPETIYGDTIYGSTNNYIVINAETENLDACLKLLDIFANPDAQILRTMGPEGDYWETTEDGHLYLTDKAKAHLEKGDGSAYVYENGEEAYMWNTDWILNGGNFTSYKGYDEEYVPIIHLGWNEEQQYTTNTQAYNAWKETVGYDSLRELLTANNALVVESSLDIINSFTTTPEDSMQLVIDTLRDVIVEASWQMVYADSEEQFKSIWNKMVEDCEGLGAKDVIDWRLADLDAAKAIRDSINE